MFIKTISEEYPNCKDEVSTERKAELKSLLLQQMPHVFELLKRTLKRLIMLIYFYHLNRK